MNDYSVYLNYICNNNYQVFIKNNSSKADFIRIITGYTELNKGKRIAKVLNTWIISPLQKSSDQVFIQNVNKLAFRNKRPWVAFESVRRGKPNKTVGCFIASSPVPSKWRKTIGSTTYFDIKAIDSLNETELHEYKKLAS